MPRGWGRKFQYEAKPARGRSAYCFFVQDNYRQVKRQLFDATHREILRELGQQWKNSPWETQNEYGKLAKLDKDRAGRAKEEYLEMVASGRIKPAPERLRVSDKPGYPRRPRTPYIRYFVENYHTVAGECRHMSQGELAAEIAKRWSRVSEDERNGYKEEYQRDMRAFTEQKGRYRAQEAAKRRQKKKDRIVQRVMRLQIKFNRKGRPVEDPVRMKLQDEPGFQEIPSRETIS